jgi:hypothetical protein
MLLPFTSPTICSPVSSICLSCICSCKKKKIPFAVELNVCTATVKRNRGAIQAIHA